MPLVILQNIVQLANKRGLKKIHEDARGGVMYRSRS
jgi:hypothetical protein